MKFIISEINLRYSNFFLYFILNKKTYEIRTYEKNKFVQIKYRTVEPNDPSKKKITKDNKSDTIGNKNVMKIVWELMQYTQGGNEERINMKLLMPVFVAAETLESQYKG